MSLRHPPINFDAYNSPAPPPPPAAAGTKRGRDGKVKESFSCPHPGCGQEYSRMEYLKRHQRKHQDVRPFDCKDCEKSFARSDVLLRHRRRCHPTPPPESRSSRSPGPARSYPSVPVSSSRNDSSRELSPTRDRRAHNHNEYPENVGDTIHSRTRTGSAEDDEDAFALAQQMQASGSRERAEIDPEGDGGVYDIGGDYYNLGESSTYTPHLLPMFQNQISGGSYHPNGSGELEDQNPNHLEDASVLLSMAYPGGVPGDGSGQQGSGSHDGSGEWNVEGNDTMMEGNGSRSIGAGHNGAGESVGSFLSSMGWLGTTASQEKEANAGDARSWVSAAPPSTILNDSIDPSLNDLTASTVTAPMGSQYVGPIQPTQLFPVQPMTAASPSNSLTGLFSPSIFGFGPLPPLMSTSEDSSPDDMIDELDNGAVTVKNLLDQMARYDMPDTKPPKLKPNPNLERPLISIEHDFMHVAAGKLMVGPDSPFYVDPMRFMTCYEIPHWHMPPVRVLSLMATKTYHTVLNHFSFIHQPTFRLHDTAACLAFAICTVGGIRSSFDTEKDYNIMSALMKGMNPDGTTKMDGPVVPGATWESTYAKNYGGSMRGSGSWNGSQWSPTGSSSSGLAGAAERELNDEKRLVEEWDAANLVRNDKTNMLVKSFSQAKGVLMTDYNCGLLQALVLYHAPYYLSENEHERAMANIFMGTIVNITRQIGFLTSELEHYSPVIELPVEPSTPNDLNFAWRRWIQLETRRRTAYLVYHLDTVSALEANIPCILTSCEYSDLPLPAPDTLWKAPNAEAWAAAAVGYKSMTLDEAMRRVFFLPSYGSFDTLHAAADTKYYNLLNEQTFGPFARVAMILTLVRGLIDIGEGKRDRGDWRDLTDLWMACNWLRPGKKMLDGEGRDVGEVSRESLRERFAAALVRWREGWDFDPLCTSRDGASVNGATGPANGAGGSGSKTLMYCEEALPFYWLAQALLSILNSTPTQEPSFNALRGLKYGEMLKSARTFTRLGEGAGAASAISMDTPSSGSASGSTSSTRNGNGRLSGLSYPGGVGNMPKGGVGVGGARAGVSMGIGQTFGTSNISATGGGIIPGLSPGGFDGLDLELLGGRSSPGWTQSF